MVNARRGAAALKKVGASIPIFTSKKRAFLPGFSKRQRGYFSTTPSPMVRGYTAHGESGRRAKVMKTFCNAGRARGSRNEAFDWFAVCFNFWQKGVEYMRALAKQNLRVAGARRKRNPGRGGVLLIVRQAHPADYKAKARRGSSI